MMQNLFGEDVQNDVEECDKPKKLKLFDYLNNITYNKRNLIDDLDNFDCFMISKCLGFGENTLGFANMMNRYNKIPKRQQYLFYLYGIPKHKAYNKWPKMEKETHLKELSEIYGEKIANDLIYVLTDRQISDIVTSYKSRRK